MDGQRLSPPEALALFGGTFILFLLASFILPSSSLSVVIEQVLLIGLPTVLLVRGLRIPLRSGLGLVMPRGSVLVGAFLVGASFWLLNLRVSGWLLDRLIRDPERLAELERHMPWLEDPMWLRLVAVAIVPAICEELMLRGAIARALRPAIGIGGAVMASSLLFATLHFPVARMVPVALFGAALAYAAVITDSVVPGVLMHFLNNLIAVVLLPAAPAVVAWINANVVFTTIAAAAATTAGLLLIRGRSVS